MSRVKKSSKMIFRAGTDFMCAAHIQITNVHSYKHKKKVLTHYTYWTKICKQILIEGWTHIEKILEMKKTNVPNPVSSSLTSDDIHDIEMK